jgi:hypothetical protein
MDVQYYPVKPIQQPRIPIWVPGIWPRMKSMRRILKCDGFLPQKMDAEGKFVDVLPDDLRQMKAFIDANRSLTTPFDYVIEGKTGGLAPAQAQEKILPYVEAGATWWIEGLWGDSEEQALARIEQAAGSSSLPSHRQ